MKKRILKMAVSLVMGTVCVMASSALSTFASEVSLGDVNMDGKIDSSDASAILMAYSALSVNETPDLSEEQLSAADINVDGSVNSSDASDVLVYYSYLSVGGDESITEYFGLEPEVPATGEVDESQLEPTPADFSVLDPAMFNVKESYDAGKKQFTLKWDSLPVATGYHVDIYTDQYYDDEGQPFKYSADVTGTSCTAQLPSALGDNHNYRYKITPFAKADGYRTTYSKVRYIDGSTGAYFKTGKRAYNSVKFKVNTADLTPHDTYPIYDIRNGAAVKVDIGDRPFDGDALYINDNEKAILQKFADEHFTKGMTNYDKVLYFMKWVHDNNSYATYDQYQKYTMWDGNFVNDVVNLKVGQCLQFNGSACELMALMGYDVYMLHCYSEGGYPHYRFELNIDGIVYGMEVGDRQYDNPATGYRWEWAFDTNRPMLLVRPDKK